MNSKIGILISSSCHSKMSALAQRDLVKPSRSSQVLKSYPQVNHSSECRTHTYVSQNTTPQFKLINAWREAALSGWKPCSQNCWTAQFLRFWHHCTSHSILNLTSRTLVTMDIQNSYMAVGCIAWKQQNYLRHKEDCASRDALSETRRVILVMILSSEYLQARTPVRPAMP